MKSIIAKVSKKGGVVLVTVAEGKSYQVKTRRKLAKGAKVELKVQKKCTSKKSGTAKLIGSSKVKVTSGRVNSDDGRKR